MYGMPTYSEILAANCNSCTELPIFVSIDLCVFQGFEKRLGFKITPKINAHSDESFIAIN